MRAFADHTATIIAALALAATPLRAQEPVADSTLFRQVQHLQAEYRALLYRFTPDQEPTRAVAQHLGPLQERLDSIRIVRRTTWQRIHSELRALRYRFADGDQPVIEVRKLENDAQGAFCAITPDDPLCLPDHSS